MEILQSGRKNQYNYGKFATPCTVISQCHFVLTKWLTTEGVGGEVDWFLIRVYQGNDEK